MRGVAILACFSGVLWGMPASAEELSVPADYQGRQMQLRADFEQPDWARDFDATSWAQFFLNYLLGNGAVTAVIPGTNKVEHMENNLGAGRGPSARRRAASADGATLRSVS